MNRPQKLLLFHVGLAFSLLMQFWFLWWTVIYPSAVWRRPVWIFADLTNFLLLVVCTLFVGIFMFLSEHPDALQISLPSFRRKSKKEKKAEEEAGKRPLF
jgi:hypothetical protein